MTFDIKFTKQGFANACLTPRGLPSDSTSILKAEPGKLDIKRSKPGNLFISLPSLFTLQTSKYDVMIGFCVSSVSLAMSLKMFKDIMA